MPELPEVETIRQDLRTYLVGKAIKDIDLILPRISETPPRAFRDTLAGKHFKGIDRIGKLLIFSFREDKDLFLLIHLRMTGQLIFESPEFLLAGGHSEAKAPASGKNKHTRAIFHLSDQSTLFFNDLRTFGKLKLTDNAGLLKEKGKFGIEPLTASWQLTALSEALAKRYSSIKSVLLDQKRISGLGNIYVDEILFASGIAPMRPAASLDETEVRKIFKNTEAIISEAIDSRGTTFNNYTDGRGRKGSYVKKLKVYGRGKENCLKCKTPLKKIKQNGRGTVFCPRCQK